MSLLPPDDPTDPSFSYDDSPHLYLFTSLTAGSSHIITATSRLETILKANRISFKAVDTATDEKARRIWTRRAGKRKLPGLVREGMVLAGMEEIEEWNEYGELKQNLGTGPSASAQQQPAAVSKGLPVEVISTSAKQKPVGGDDGSSTRSSVDTMHAKLQSSLAAEAAAAAKLKKTNTGAKAAMSDKSDVVDDSAMPKPLVARPRPGVDDSKIRPIPDALKEKLGLKSIEDGNRAEEEGEGSTGAENVSAPQTGRNAQHPVLSSDDVALKQPVIEDAAVQAASMVTTTAAEEATTPAAAPASKAGLEAVTDNPALADHPLDDSRRGGRAIAASQEDIKSVEDKNTIPEESSKEEEIKSSAAKESIRPPQIIPSTPSSTKKAEKGILEESGGSTSASGAEKKSNGQKVTFQEDILKGRAADGREAGETVGD